ncbi:AraC-like DNA-binding protein [Algoriphagus sp. 4150]|uniref:helix-turn-helix transcriptional regulator n=1 Tax=Algoriphagus sp. 4150 TaxID=2817756 RepID=UPI0028640B52|nr:AraC family transcriptional regulator [Algoriphagus sp. 4150]MDR7129566.1 AraC-like DNA-binding protein [Algoriphagus sp. 4150]
MHLRLYDNDGDKIFFEKEYPDRFLTHGEGIKESITYHEQLVGSGFYKEIYFEGVHIGFGNTVLKRKILLNFESDIETIEMHFALKGKSTATTGIFDKSISFVPNRHNIIYANGICGKMQWESEEFRLCEINLTPFFFKKFLPQDHQLFETFRNTIEKGNSGLLHQDHRRISHQMYRIIDEIMGCERTGIFKRMFLEAKVIELLLLQLEQFSDDSFSHSTLKKPDVDKIYAVREFILQNLDATCSLIDLAHLVGTNDFILKKGFKELFGTTVFGFWSDAKMDQAKQLLMGENMNVGEVSQRIGYKNQRHFSAAFKRKFGILPSHFKK